jgi:hypothetical protein
MSNCPTITIETSDNKEVPVPYRAITRIKLLSNMVDTTRPSENVTIPMSNVHSECLNLVINILDACPLGVDIRWFDWNLLKQNPNMLVADLVEATNFMECTEVLDVVLLQLAKAYKRCIQERSNIDDRNVRTETLQKDFTNLYNGRLDQLW